MSSSGVLGADGYSEEDEPCIANNNNNKAYNTKGLL